MGNMVVNTNTLALNSYNSLKKVGSDQAKASARLSSGLRINSAADDSAGLAISEKMRAQIRGLDMASKNAQDGSSMIQTAEGGLAEIDNMLQRIRELTVQASNDTNQGYDTDTNGTATASLDNDRTKIQAEVSQLTSEIASMAKRVEFNKKTLLDGSPGKLRFQVGANAYQMIEVDLTKDFSNINELFKGYDSTYTLAASNASSAITNGSALGTDSSTLINNGMWSGTVSYASAAGGVSNSTQAFTDTIQVPDYENSSATAISGWLKDIDQALTAVTKTRASLGAVQNRLEYTQNSLDVSSENLTAAESRIRDADMAKEMMNLTKTNVLQQAATSMLAQGNQAPQNVLQLLR